MRMPFAPLWHARADGRGRSIDPAATVAFGPDIPQPQVHPSPRTLGIRRRDHGHAQAVIVFREAGGNLALALAACVAADLRITACPAFARPMITVHGQSAGHAFRPTAAITGMDPVARRDERSVATAATPALPNSSPSSPSPVARPVIDRTVLVFDEFIVNELGTDEFCAARSLLPCALPPAPASMARLSRLTGQLLALQLAGAGFGSAILPCGFRRF